MPGCSGVGVGPKKGVVPLKRFRGSIRALKGFWD